MENFVQNGEFLHTVLADTVAGGDLVIVGSVVGVAVSNGDNVELKAVQTKGVFTLPKEAALAVSQGDTVYWDASAKAVTKTAEANTIIGVAWDAALSADGTVNVKIG